MKEKGFQELHSRIWQIAVILVYQPILAMGIIALGSRLKNLIDVSMALENR